MGVFVVLLIAVILVVSVYALGAALVVGGIHILARSVRDDLRDDGDV